MIKSIEMKNEIEQQIITELALNGYTNPSPDYVLAALEGLLEAWKEDESDSPEKASWMMALEMLIMDYTIKTFIHSLKKK